MLLFIRNIFNTLTFSSYKRAKAEKMAELYRFAEFGRISSGVFHDLVNPLSAISLNIRKLKDNSEKLQISETAEYVEKAIYSVNKLESLVYAVRKQLVRKENKANFSLNKEVEYVVNVLSHKAKKSHVVINFKAPEDIQIYGEAIKFNQIALNLIANAIESYSEENQNENIVNISLYKKDTNIIFKVEDNGAYISKKNLHKIFKPFFTTKTKEGGVGLGLSMTKSTIEKSFGGRIDVSSRPGKTTFIVKIPHNNKLI